MLNFKIFTESKADIKFLIDFIEERFHISLTEESFYSLNSWAGYRNEGNVIAAIRENYDEGYKTILILDANGNYAQRLNEVTTDFRNYGFLSDLFLFPDNASNGTLENLLCAIAVEQPILRCFEEYEACIQHYESPSIKSKVFAYLDALVPQGNKKGDRQDLIQEAKRNYRNAAHWNLHHDYLQPLYDFLAPFFIEVK